MLKVTTNIDVRSQKARRIIIKGKLVHIVACMQITLACILSLYIDDDTHYVVVIMKLAGLLGSCQHVI
jgi:hypothetical protein